MTDIMDEKPKSGQWVSFKYPVKDGESLKLPIYDAEEMDAWLERLIMNYENRLLRMSKKIKELRLSTQTASEET